MTDETLKKSHTLELYSWW